MALLLLVLFVLGWAATGSYLLSLKFLAPVVILYLARPMQASHAKSPKQVSPPPQLASAVPARPDPRLGGVWVKDVAASDSMEAACTLMHLNGIVRMAIKLIRGIEIEFMDGEFRMAVFSAVKWFKVREAYPLDGSDSLGGRRDLRRGKVRGSVSVHPAGVVAISLQWGEPHGGTGTDTFRLVAPDELHVTSRVETREGSSSYTTVYRRKH